MFILSNHLRAGLYPAMETLFYCFCEGTLLKRLIYLAPLQMPMLGSNMCHPFSDITVPGLLMDEL